MTAAPAVRPRLPLLGNLLEYRRDRLAFLAKCRDRYGPLAWVRFGRTPVLVVSSAEAFGDILVQQQRDYGSRGAIQSVRFLLGDSLSPSNVFSSVIKACCGCMHEQAMLASDGEEHWEQRRAARPGPSPEERQHFIDVMAARADAATERWTPGLVDVESAVRWTAFEIVARTLLGVEGDLRDLLAAFRTIITENVSGSTPSEIVERARSKRKRRERYVDAWDSIEAAIDHILDRAREGHTHVASGLSALLADESGRPSVLTEKRVRHYVFQMLGMGHATTASALAFALSLLAENPFVADAVRGEIERATSGEALTEHNLAEMPLLECTIHEALRLYPVIWADARQTLRRTELLGETLEAGTYVLLNTWGMQRDSRYHPDPDRFRPDRFSGMVSAGHRPAGYLPFGAGPHVCIGERFALLEMKVVIATLLRRFAFAMPAGSSTRAMARTIILEPLGGTTLEVTPLPKTARIPVRAAT